MLAKVKRKVRGATLIETIVAMVIVVSVFSSALVLIGQTSHAIPSHSELTAMNHAEQMLDDAFNRRDYTPHDEKKPPYTYRFEAEQLPGFTDRVRLSAVVLRDTVVVGKRTRIVAE